MTSKLNRRAQRLQASARATLLWAVGCVIAVQGASRLIIDRVWPELRDPAYEIKARRLERVLAQRSDRPITVLMTGSSVTTNGFKAKQLEEQLAAELGRDAVVFNMGANGAGALTQLIWMRRLLERGVRPDLVCVEFSPQMYDAADVPLDAHRFPVHLLTKQDIKTIQPYVHNPELRREWRWYRWCPAYFHRLTILSYSAAMLVPVNDRVSIWTGEIDERFWAELQPPPRARLEANIRGMRDIHAAPLAKLTPGEPSMRALEELLDLLQSHQIPAAVVRVPQSPALRQLYAAARLEAFVKRVAELSGRHKMPFVDAFDWLDEEQFTDCIHPTAAGADVFSTRLKREVLAPMLARQQRQLAGR